MLMPRRRGWSAVKHGAQPARSGGRYGAVWRRHSEPRCGAAIKAWGSPKGGPLPVPNRCLHYDSVSMIANLFFWLGTRTKPTDSRHWVGSFVVGILFPLFITAGLFMLLALGGSY